jgi:predicted glutamine amidotransferase
MCRALAYLGQPVLLDHLLFQPDSALVRQSTMPKMLNMLNLAGFGLRARVRNSHEWKMIGGSDAADSIIIASEPLTKDTSTWLEVPEYSMIYADTRGGVPSVEIHYLD